MAAFQRPVSVKVSAINDHLVCRLCGGYIIEATAVVECLHAFCRSCIVKHVKKPKEKHQCPVCNVLIREAQPLAGLRLDRTLQDIIEKLLPQIQREEEQREELFNANRNIDVGPLSSRIKTNSSRSSPVERPLPPSTEEKVSLFIRPPSGVESVGGFQKYLRCSARMTVVNLKRFLVEKTGWDQKQMEVLCKGQTLRDELTLEFIWRIRWGNPQSMLILEYTRNDTEVTAVNQSKRRGQAMTRKRSSKEDKDTYGGNSTDNTERLITDSTSSCSE